MSANKRKAERRGRWAEALAALWLRAKGYRIIGQGVRRPGGEIELIARRGAVVAFVEVKARATLAQAADAVTPRQRRRIEAAATAFLAGRPDLAESHIRFDVVLVRPWARPVHQPDAWRP